MIEPPAFRAFDRDRRVRIQHLRVFRDCQAHLNFHDPTTRKVDAIGAAVGMGKGHVSTALRDLIAWGYVREAGWDEYGTRLMLLAYTVPKAGTTSQADAA